MGFAWDSPPRVIGHRGAPHDAVENTLASFEAARAAGARAVELDARLSADGFVVVHHDVELGRVVPGEGRIEDLPVALLRARGVPLLAEVLALPLLVNVEIKADAENAQRLPARVLDVVRATGALERVLVTSFDHALADEYARLSDRPAGAIFPYAPEEADLMPRLPFVALAEDAAIPETLDALAALGRKTLVWTVNEERSAARLLAEGASGIITDRPGPLARFLGEGAPAT